MSRVKLDPKLVEKLAAKLGRKKPHIQSTVSKLAAKHAISAEAALVLLAKQAGIGTAHYLKRLPINAQQEVRTTLPVLGDRAKPEPMASADSSRSGSQARSNGKTSLSQAIALLLQDTDLKGRVADLLRAGGKYDRVFREATTVLEHIIKSRSGARGTIQAVLPKALNPDPTKAILVVSDEPSEQQGFFNVCQGIFLAFRNATHHALSDQFTREDALKFCAFIDLQLAAIKRAKAYPERLTK
jgi:hypothetical protein